MSRLEALKQQFAQKTSGGNSENWSKYYPFWKMEVDQTAIVRFLPDLDESNPFGFLVENHTHDLYINGEKKTVACAKMYGKSCPICEQSAKYYAEKNDELGKKYYRKLSYIGQVVVIESPFEHDQEQLVKLIDFGPKIFKLIQAAFQSGDLEKDPDSLKGGYNFRIKKTKSGQWADYTTSSFAPKQTDLDDELIEQIQLLDLKEQRRREVPRAELEALLHADMTGVDVPSQNKDSDDVPNHPSPSLTKSDSTDSSDTPTPTSSGNNALAALRAKAKAKAQTEE